MTMVVRRSDRLRHVIDLSIKILDEDCQVSSCDNNTSDSMSFHVCCSLESNGPPSALDHQRRCLFSKYWAKQMDRDSQSCSFNDKTKVYNANKEMDSRKTIRRTIFANRYELSAISDISIISLDNSSSSSSLDSLTCFSETAEIEVKSLQSCLRKSRFSATQAPVTQTLCPVQVVSFSSEVETRIFHVPIESWSSDNWSEHFAWLPTTNDSCIPIGIRLRSLRFISMVNYGPLRIWPPVHLLKECCKHYIVFA